MTALIVVPARWGSTRFPGKPLATIAGRTLLERVVAIGREAARLAGDAGLLVATDDARIMDAAAGLGCQATLTPSSITTGSERALAAAMQAAPPPDHIVNLQGDAPFVPPGAVAEVIRALRRGSAACVTPVVRLSWSDLDAWREQKRRSPFSGTSCVRSDNGRALWFSKAILPAIRNEEALRREGTLSPVWRHLGLYGYTRVALRRFTQAAPSRYEELEGLEQLRLLELGLVVDTVEIARPRIAMTGIDSPADAVEAERLIAQWGDPFQP